MAYSAVWDEAQPLGSVAASDIDQLIRDEKRNMRERVAGIFGLSAAQWIADPIVVISLALSTFIAAGAAPAQSGPVRIPNGAYVTSRNFANLGDVNMIRVNSSNQVEVGAALNAPSGVIGNITGNVTGNLTGTVLTAAQGNITSLGTLTGLTITGGAAQLVINGTAGALIIINSATGSSPYIQFNINAVAYGYFGTSGSAGALITGAATGDTNILSSTGSINFSTNAGTRHAYLTGGTFTATAFVGTLNTAAQPNITSLGTLTSLNVSGNTNSGSYTLNGIAGVAGWYLAQNTKGLIVQNSTGGNKVAVTLDAANIWQFGDGLASNFNAGITATGFTGNLTGTVLTAAQGNITSVGTLTGLSINSGGSTIITVDGGAASSNYHLYRLAGVNKAYIGIAGSAAALMTGTAAGDVVFRSESTTILWSTGGSGARDMYLTAGVLTATTFVGNLTGTVLTAAQGNITSIGALTSLTVSGNTTTSSLTLTGNPVSFGAADSAGAGFRWCRVPN